MRGKSIRLPETGSFFIRMLRGISGRNHALEVLQHELRTPLAGILGMAALLRESRLTGEQRQFLTALEQSGRQLAGLLENGGTWLAAGSLKGTVNAFTFNGLHLLESMTRAHWPAARRQNLGMFLIFDHRLPVYWHTDPALLREALDNLLANAIKFTSRGYVLLEARRFMCNARTQEGLELRVIDTGVGIPRRDERRIYSFGMRGSDRKVRHRGGSGYGLYIADRIATALGGSLHHARDRQGGTRFAMRLPGALLTVPESAERLQPRLLRGMNCQVSLPPPLDRVVAHALRRTGVGASLQKAEAFVDWPDQVDARIVDSRPSCGIRDLETDGMESIANRFASVYCRPVLQGRPGGRSTIARESGPGAFSWALHEPVLHANLEPQILQFALHLRMNVQ